MALSDTTDRLGARMRGENKRRRESRLGALAFVVPALVLFLGFVVYPLASGVYYSFFRWAGYGIPEFLGLGNYVNLFQDPNFLNAIVVTATYTVFTTILQTAVPMFLAILLTQRWRGAVVFRTAIFIPSIISLTITGLLWQLALQPNGGLVDELLSAIGLGGLSQAWLGQAALVVPVIIVVSLWQSVGFYLLIFYAGLLAVDPGMYESARLDGAYGWKLTRFITIPSIRPVIILVVSLNVINGLKVYDLMYAMTSGGPGNASQSLGVYLYQLAFGSENGGTAAFGYANAIGVLIMVAAACLLIVTNRTRRGR
jgi:ABC-type sugar transport system permease subunit